MRSRLTALALAALVACAVARVALAAGADMILFNGKIITVDDQFSIAQAVAIADGRIVAVGRDEDLKRDFAGPQVRQVDLGGRTVVPGLMDGHIHLFRGAEFWRSEVRLDGVTSRSAAGDLIRGHAQATGKGTWILTLGGWTEKQFGDDRRPFNRADLDLLAPDNPVFMQLGYGRGYANTPALQQAGIKIEDKSATDRDVVERDNAGVATGQVSGLRGIAMIRRAVGKGDREDRGPGLHAIMSALNEVGVTAVYDPGGFGLKPEDYKSLESYARSGQSTVRVYRSLWVETPTLADVPKTVTAIHEARGFAGDDVYDLIAVGETVYSPLHDNFQMPLKPSAEERQAITAIFKATAERGLQFHLHAIEHDTVSVYLDAIESVAAGHNIRPLRWTFAHTWNLTPDQIERMRRFGIGIALQSGSSFDDTRTRVAGEAGYQMPSLRVVQESGLTWGLGTDATVVGLTNPFITLGWAVTGAMPNGQVTNKATVTREQALIAHTRSNAFLAFRENTIGSLQPGKLADLVVLDRDYLTVPANEIWRIRPVATMLAGKVVFGRLP